MWYYWDMQVPHRKAGKYAQMATDPHLTEVRAFEIRKKIEQLKKAIRTKLAPEVAILAEGGDFSENAGYQAAKGRLRSTNQKIWDLEEQLRRAIIIPLQKQTDTVGLGHNVTISRDSKLKTYQILGSAEVDLQKGIISQNSPLGSKLMSRRVGDVIKMIVGNKEIEYKVVKIEMAKD